MTSCDNRRKPSIAAVYSMRRLDQVRRVVVSFIMYGFSWSLYPYAIYIAFDFCSGVMIFLMEKITRPPKIFSLAGNSDLGRTRHIFHAELLQLQSV